MPTTNKPAPVATGTDPGLTTIVTGPVGPLDRAPDPVLPGPGLGVTANIPTPIPVVTVQTETVDVATATASSFVPNTISTNTVVKYLSISDESVAVNGQVTNINFVGTGVSVANNANAINSVVVTIDSGGTYGNSNVVSLLAGFGSNTLSTTGNVTGGNLVTSAQVVASGVIQSGTGLSTGGYLSVDGGTDLHNTTVTGNLSATGNITGSYILGNGSQLTGLAATYSNSNVQAYLPTYSGNIGALTVTGNLTVTGTTSTVNTEVVNVSESVVGNIDAGNLRTAGQVSAAGNITGNFFIGNGSALSSLTGANVSGTVANATYALTSNAATYSTQATTADTANAVAGANVSGTVANATYALNSNAATYSTQATYADTANAVAGANVSGTVANATYALTSNAASYSTQATSIQAGNSFVRFGGDSGPIAFRAIGNGGASMSGNTFVIEDTGVTVNGFNSATGNVIGGNILTIGNISTAGNITANNLGNISTINLTGSSSNVLYGNGTFAPAAGGAANTGNVTFNDVNIIGTGNLNLQPNGASSEYLNIFLTGSTDIHVAAGGGVGNVILGTDAEANIAILQGGNVAIQAGNVAGTKTWSFDTAGNLTLPGNAFAVNYANGTAVSLGGGGGGNSISDGTSNVSVVAANGNVVIGVNNDAASWTFATNGDIYAKPETDLILVVADPNGDGYAVKQSLTDGTTELSRTSLEDGQFSIYTNLDGAIDEWRFDGNTLQVSNNSFIRGFDSNITVQSMFAGGNGTASLQSVSNQNDPNVFSTFDATTTSANIKVYNGGSNGGTGYTWNFDNSGNLTLPGNAFAVNYANGTAVSLGGGSGTVTNVQGDGIVSGLSLTGNVTTTGNLTLGGTLDLSSLSGNISTTGNITAANLGNIASINLDGNVSNVLAGNGTWIAAGGGGIGNLSAFGNVIYSNVTGTPTGFVNFDTGNGSMLLGTNSTDQVQIVVDEIGTPKSWTFATDGSLAAPGAVSATGNVTGGNLLTGGIVSSTGNITGGNISATNHTGTTVSVSGNITSGNILTGGVVSATGNGTFGNISTAGSGGNITGANVITATTFSATGTASNLVRRANTIAAANAVVTLDNITAQLGGSPTRLYIGAANSNMTMAGTSQTITTGSLAAASWINVPIVTGAGNAFAMSGAISANGDTVILNVTDQGAGSGTWRVTGLIANTSSNLYSVSIERLA